MEKNKKWIGAGRFDSSESHYKHKILLDNRIELVGYSKSLLGREGIDKIVVLERMILRLVNNGYVFGKTKAYGNKTVRLEYFLDGKFSGEPDELIVTLYPDKYVFEKNETYTNDIRLNTFLKRLYEQAKEGIIVTKSLIHKPKVSVDFDINKLRFKNEPELYKWMQLKIKEGNPVGLVTNFYLKYREKHLVNALLKH